MPTRSGCWRPRAPTSDERSATQAFPRRRSGQSVLPLGSWTPLMYAARQNAQDAARALRRGGREAGRNRSRRRHGARRRHHQRQLRHGRAAPGGGRGPERRRQGSRHGAALRGGRHAPAGDRPWAAEPEAVGHADGGRCRAPPAGAQGRPERGAEGAHLPAPSHVRRRRAGRGRDAADARRQVGRRRSDAAVAGGRRRSAGDAGEPGAPR